MAGCFLREGGIELRDEPTFGSGGSIGTNTKVERGGGSMMSTVTMTMTTDVWKKTSYGAL